MSSRLCLDSMQLLWSIASLDSNNLNGVSLNGGYVFNDSLCIRFACFDIVISTVGSVLRRFVCCVLF